MKLLGIRDLDVNQGNKILGMINKLDDISNEFEDTEYRLEVGCHEKFSNEWTGDIYLICLEDNGKLINYLCWEDMDDGYSSYTGSVEITGYKCIRLNNFETLDLEVEVKKQFKTGTKEHDLQLVNNDVVVFDCYTDFDDGYYPCGKIECKIW